MSWLTARARRSGSRKPIRLAAGLDCAHSAGHGSWPRNSNQARMQFRRLHERRQLQRADGRRQWHGQRSEPTPASSWTGDNVGAYPGGYGGLDTSAHVPVPDRICIMSSGSSYCPVVAWRSPKRSSSTWANESRSQVGLFLDLASSVASPSTCLYWAPGPGTIGPAHPPRQYC